MHRKKKRDKRRRHMSGVFEKIPYAYIVGDFLYMVGFWAEYAGVCAWRKLRGIVGAIAATIGNLLLLIVRPFVLGILTFVEDLTSPFTRMASGLRTSVNFRISWRKRMPGRSARPRCSISGVV